MSRVVGLFGLLSLLVLASFVVPPAAAKGTPLFYETTVVEDTDGDFTGRGHLDIVAVYLTEKFGFDPEKKIMKGDELVWRIEMSALSDIQTFCEAQLNTARYDIFFKVDGSQQNVSAFISTYPVTDNQKSCGMHAGSDVPGGTAPATITGNSVSLAVPSADFGVVPGSQITEIWAVSSIADPAGQYTAQDIAPADNANTPSGQQTAPTEGLGTYSAVGVFPFISVVPVTPLAQYSVLGGEVKYQFQFISHPEISNDNIRVRFTIPDGWTVSPSRGTTGADPEGQLSGGSAGAPVDFAFTTTSTGIVNDGDMAHLMMDVITDSGGHVPIMIMTTVSGPKISDPNLTLDLQSKGPFEAGDAQTIRFSASHPTIVLDQQQLSIDVIQGTKRITTLTAKPVGGGIYEVMYAFPAQGEYKLDVYVSSMHPSPHQEFTVSVQKGGLAPGPGFVTVALVALVGVALALRRHA